MMLGLTKGLMKKLLPDAEVPKALRTELLNLEQLEQYAENFARNHVLSQDLRSTELLDRLDENESILRAFNLATQSLDSNRRITPATEWLLDNFYIIEDQIQMARRHFPKAYSRELPCGKTRLPRVYEIALELISHVDAQVDLESLSAFITAFQRVTPLKLGELWAIPIMLRLGLIENLQRIASQLAMARQNRSLAMHWVSRLEAVQEKNPSHLVVEMAQMAQSDLPFTSAFVAEFCQSLLRTQTTMHWTKAWFEQLLSEKGLSMDLLTQEENQIQASEQVSVRQSIMSLRFLGALNWKDFVESMSEVERVLKQDPQGIYSQMDFFTRDAYRHGIEAISARGDLSEIEVAESAVELSKEGLKNKGVKDRSSHVGYYLLGKGRKLLEKSAHTQNTWKNKLERILHRFPKTYYFGGLFLFTNIIGCSLIFYTLSEQYGLVRNIIFSILILLCSSQMGVAIIHWISTLILHPRLLPRLDFSKEIPPEQATMVVIPTLLASSRGIDRLLETIEIHFLGNRDPHLFFAILTDFPDAASERMPDDEERLLQARSGIESLNQKYSENLTSSFFMFHRPRRWNPLESCWMGYERKRGKLAEFNSLLIRRSSDRFSEIVGNFKALPKIASVITLDTDTQMPREVARQMIGTIAHPLNRPYFDPQKRRVTEGYTILQPRATASLLSSTRSWYGRLFAGEVGIDPYTKATSDLYQDLFGEGSFVGKGIYDLEAFEQATASAFPENLILSHDLIESCYSRCALLSDVILYEDYPSCPIAEMKRQHRWTRGDWQIARWLRSTVIQGDGKVVRNPLTLLSQWKITDNLRRCLMPVGLLSLLVGSWCFYPEMEGMTLLISILTVSLSSVLSLFMTYFRKPKELPFTLHFHESMEATLRHLAQATFDLLFLPAMAALYLDAMIRTWFRLMVSHQHLLEWQTAGEVERSGSNQLQGYYTQMAAGPLLSLFIGFVLFKFSAGIDAFQVIILLLWFFSPLVAWRMGRPTDRISETLDPSQKIFLRLIARKTWRFLRSSLMRGKMIFLRTIFRSTLFLLWPQGPHRPISDSLC